MKNPLFLAAFVVASVASLGCEPDCERTQSCGPYVPANGGAGGSSGGTGGGGASGGSPPLNVRALVAGQNSVCALVREGETWCWGIHHYGDDEIHGVPEQISGVGIALGVGSDHTCRLGQVGNIECWGQNADGQLGDGSTNDSDVAVGVALAPAKELVAGGQNTCAMTESGAAFCWGSNVISQVPSGPPSNATLPQDIAFPNAEKISMGTQFSCALRSGTAWCWGSNLSKQADPISVQNEVVIPTAINLGFEIVDVSAGGSNACVATADGEVWCWGDNSFGQHGPLGHPLPPFQVLGINNVVDVETGGDHTCAIRQDGTLWCWGLNYNGQLGIGTSTKQTTPTQVPIGCAVTHLTTNLVTCAMCESGAVWCWGSNVFGMLGIGGAGGNSNVPVKVVGF